MADQLLYVATTTDLLQVIDTSTNAVVGSLSVSPAANASAICIDEVANRGYLSYYSARNFEEVDLSTLTGGSPVSSLAAWSMVMAPDRSKFMIGGFDVGLTTFTNPGLSSPGPAAINGYVGVFSPDSSTFYIGEFQSLYQVDVASLTVTRTLTAGGTPIFLQCALNPAGTELYAIDSNHPVLYVIPTPAFTSFSTVTLPDSCTSLVLSPDGTTLWAYSSNSNELIPISLPGLTVGTPIPTGTNSNTRVSIIILPDNTTCYIQNGTLTAIQPVNLSTGALGTPIPVAGVGDICSMALGPASTPVTPVTIRPLFIPRKTSLEPVDLDVDWLAIQNWANSLNP